MSEVVKKPWTFLRAIPFVFAGILYFELAETLSTRFLDGDLGGPVLLALVSFLVTTGFFFAVYWRSLLEFFRSIQVGIIVFVFLFLGSGIGVMVPQIDNFEDPQERVNAQNEEENYKAFKWAVGYFVYHMSHPYGLGMPEASIPRQAQEGLERLGKKYGKELAQNRGKEMSAAFRNNAKNQEIQEHIEEHKDLYRGLFKVCTLFDFNRAYKSGWFLGIHILLFFCIFSNWFRFGWRAWFTAQRFGFFLAHLGALTILAGGFVSKLTTVRGIVHLNVGRSSSEYWAFYNPKKVRELPFQLRLEDFKRDDWDKLEVHFLDEQFKSSPPRYTIWKGYELPLDYNEKDEPRYRVRVKEKYPRVQLSEPDLVDLYGTEESEGSGRENPVLECMLQVSGSGEKSGMERRFLFGREGDWPALLLHPDNKWRVRYVWALNAEEGRSKLLETVEEKLGGLDIRVGSGGDAIAWQQTITKAGQRFDAPKGYSIEVVEAVGRFQMQHSGSKSQPVSSELSLEDQGLEHPAVKLRIHKTGESKTEDRWVIDGFDAEEFGLQSRYVFHDLVIKLNWDYWASPVRERFVLFDVPGQELELVALGKSEAGKPVQIGQAMTMPGDSTLWVRERAREASFRFEFEPIEEVNFFHQDPAGIVLEIDTPAGTKTHRLANVPGADRVIIDGKMGIVFLEDNRAMPYEWRSRLAAVEKDLDGKPHVAAKGEIRVNDYFSWRNYHFFQTNAIPEDPSYSGVGVVYDLGMPVVVIGMYLMMGGVAIALFRRLAVKKEVAS